MIKSILYPIIFICIIFSQPLLKAENPDTTIKKINQKLFFIKSAAEKLDIDFKTLCAIIYTERELNYNWEDDALDILLAKSGLNSSIGFCQIKMKTAYWIELQLKDASSIFYCGVKYNNILKLSKSADEIINKLAIDSLNILYAAAYIKIMAHRWKTDGYPIHNKPEILGTLYSTGLFYSDGKERKPHSTPQPNKFGLEVKKSVKFF